MGVLMVFTSNDQLGDTETKTGWYLPEAAHPYYEFVKAGFEIEFGSPAGGNPPLDADSIEATKDDEECVSFLNDEALQTLYRTTYESGSGVAAAVCHGPAALTNVTLSDGSYLVAGKEVTGFSNEEEHAVSRFDIVPWTCENKLAERGATYSAAAAWGENVKSDSRVVTGQNPASARACAQAVIAALSE